MQAIRGDGAVGLEVLAELALVQLGLAEACGVLRGRGVEQLRRRGRRRRPDACGH